MHRKKLRILVVMFSLLSQYGCIGVQEGAIADLKHQCMRNEIIPTEEMIAMVKPYLAKTSKIACWEKNPFGGISVLSATYIGRVDSSEFLWVNGRLVPDTENDLIFVTLKH